MLSAEELVQEIAKAPMSLEDKMSWHFANFDTTMPKGMEKLAATVINWANSGGDLSIEFALPVGVTFRNAESATAQEIIEGHYLEGYITNA